MRVLQVGYGVIGREVFTDYAPALAAAGHAYMVRDIATDAPEGYEWDGQRVDLAVILVNTPRSEGGGFDHSDLLTAVRQYRDVADFILIRSTVTPSFLDTALYRSMTARIGFAPEFYGATQWSRRGVLQMGFSIFTGNVPLWFRRAVSEGEEVVATPIEVILAKLAENAYLATKVTFFHELHLAAERYGADPETVRSIVAHDPRIGDAHTYMVEPGWTSHCFDKDVPEYAAYADSTLVRAAILANRATLLPARKSPVPPEN
ncbi:UDP-glucose dehydrogenase [Microbacterium phage KaiHaiDragon]|uniref:UDP-glucose dehydrogenase n=1 Tax=Microbacterium phage KaiHaiDragon TaxID=2992931 RepID=A0A345MI18_9CAUD|nr:UDP-glucose dehydrogenase [Microbacterium phage KaiHaiDragon]AXH70199.1 UDP-glucose dehydrogenase [Microbacterium phage KaiHaiDragon]UVG34562.1 UDP-glucose dehydrogenase [Microbacterium phage EarickHC]